VAASIAIFLQVLGELGGETVSVAIFRQNLG
jgi:hypothetical protein